MRHVFYLLALVVSSLAVHVDANAQSWSHEYIMPDGTSYLCGGDAYSSSCANLDKKGRERLYESRQKVLEKHQACSKAGDKARDDYNKSFHPDDISRFLNPLPGWDTYKQCMGH